MKKLILSVVVSACALGSVVVAQQQGGSANGGLDPATLLKPLAESWSTYSGDYTGRRYSALTQVNKDTVKNLSLVWAARLTNGPGLGPGGVPLIVGGEGPGDIIAAAATQVKGAMIQVGDILYVTTPDNVWALDARDGHEIWHYFWKTRGGTHIGNRGVGVWRNYLFFVTPDDYLVSLDARTGAERWHHEVVPFNQQYFLTIAPMVIGDRIIIGTGNDHDRPGYLMAFEPERGNLLWKTAMTPQKEGDPGLESWGSLDAAIHGGGNPWVPGVYDPETRLYIIGSGNPTPAYMTGTRGPGDHLFTCALVALDVDTGQIKWYYQTSPHDTHDWDSAQTPVIVDGDFNGRPRKMVLTAARNGYFFVVDRTTGEHLLTSKFSETANWAEPHLNAKGQPVRIPAKDNHVAGALVSGANGGATNWPPPAYSPQTGLFYVPTAETYAMYYLVETDPRGAMGLGGKDERAVATWASYLNAIDYKTGKFAWRYKYRTWDGAQRGAGLLATAGGLLFASDNAGNFVAHDAATGKALWHTRLGLSMNAPGTFMLDGRQYVIVAAGDTVYSFALYR